MKIFYILPHCSTGGMPQYALKQVQSLENEHDITVFEVSDLSPVYIVQRKQFKNLIQLKGDRELLLKYIKDGKPDILHFQEIPESFIDSSILSKIYDPKREYNIVFTAHGMNKGRDQVTFLPDRIVAVSNWQKAKFEKEFPEIEIELWEYPVEDLVPSPEEKAEARRKLNFKTANKHILNVGLFTQYKNQGELFDIARNHPENIYHFVGNQSGGFSEYWKPLMAYKPDNCIVYGERADTDLFYKACDEMYFMSKWELYPITIREALSYGLPIYMHRLEVYSKDYDTHPLVHYFGEGDVVEVEEIELEEVTYIPTKGGEITPRAQKVIQGLMEVIHVARRKENNRKNHAFAEELRQMCKKVGITIKDKPDGTSDWELK